MRIRPTVNTSVIERQMRHWELSHEVGERVSCERAVRDLPAQVHPYVAIARQAGAQASTIARLVSEELRLELLDKELLDCMADRYNLPRESLSPVDEERTAWLREVFGRWVNDRVVPQTKYVSQLGKVVLLAARGTGVVFVGRGAHFFLPREKGLMVYVIGPREQRIERAMGENELSRGAASRYVDEKDRGRREFVLNYFRQDSTDPLLYDAVINTERVSPERAAKLIASEYRARWPRV